MASPSDLPIQSVVRWGTNAVSLKDFTSHYPTPCVVKVSKGQYRNIGVSKSVTSELLLHSVVTSNKILAESIKLRDGKKAVPSDQKFSLPLSYQGWFELLSEEGKSIKALTTVQELFKSHPQSFLIRENVKAYKANEKGDCSLDKSRVIYAGEHLTMVGDVFVPIALFKNNGFSTQKRFLKCLDQKGETVYLAFDQKGLFSPIAGQANISGVHNIKGLLEKFRMPIMVRLVHGIIPTRLDRGSFTGVFRLVSTYTDETAFVCPLKKDSKMVPISTREPLKFVTSMNMDAVESTLDYKTTLQRCSKMVSSYMNSIHVLIHQPEMITYPASKDLEKKEDTAKVTALPQHEEDVLFQEVDDIYQYVRDGGKPPNPRPRQSSSMLNSNTDLSKVGKSKNQTDENYWEEPIYERIDKFQKLKKEAVLVNSGTKVSAAINQNYLIDEKEKDGVSPFGKLSDEEKEVVKKIAPPVPPKRFDSEESGSFEEIQTPDQSISSMGISPDTGSGDNRDISVSSSGVSLNRSPPVPHESPKPNDNSFLRKTRSDSLNVNSAVTGGLETRLNNPRRHSFTPAARPTDLPLTENGERIMFRSPTEVVETSISTSRINLRSPEVSEGPTRVNIRSPAEVLDNQRKFQSRYHHSATNLSPGSMNHVVFNRETARRLSSDNDTRVNKGPVSVTTNAYPSNGASSRSTPKYVAIARVGDPSPSKRSNYNENSDSIKYDKHSKRMDNHRRQVQSIFL